MTTAPARAIGRVTEVSLRDPALLAFLIVIGAIVPAVLALATGLAEIPRNDDWSYRWIARHVFETGDVRLDGASQSFAVGTDPGDVTGPVAFRWSRARFLDRRIALLGPRACCCLRPWSVIPPAPRRSAGSRCLDHRARVPCLLELIHDGRPRVGDDARVSGVWGASRAWAGARPPLGRHGCGVWRLGVLHPSVRCRCSRRRAPRFHPRRPPAWSAGRGLHNGANPRDHTVPGIARGSGRGDPHHSRRSLAGGCSCSVRRALPLADQCSRHRVATRRRWSDPGVLWGLGSRGSRPPHGPAGSGEYHVGEPTLAVGGARVGQHRGRSSRDPRPPRLDGATGDRSDLDLPVGGRRCSSGDREAESPRRPMEGRKPGRRPRGISGIDNGRTHRVLAAVRLL